MRQYHGNYIRDLSFILAVSSLRSDYNGMSKIIKYHNDFWKLLCEEKILLFAFRQRVVLYLRGIPFSVRIRHGIKINNKVLI